MEKKMSATEVEKRLDLLEEKLHKSLTLIKEQQKLRYIDDEEVTPWNTIVFWSFHYPISCIVCYHVAHVESCNRCKMIFYCGEKHRKEHWPEHKDICKVILGMLKETGATTIFDNLKTNDAEAWMKTKIDLMLEAESRLGMPLLNYEREMFLFPKTCFVCHESDLSVLKTCECGVSLCKQHKKNERHQELCDEYYESFMMALEMNYIKPYPLLESEAQDIVKFEESRDTIPVHTEITKLPNSMKEFLKTYMKLKGETLKKVKARTNNRTQIVSEFISRPLTLLYAIQKLDLMSSSKLTVHVIGATHDEFFLGDYWEILLHWIPALKDIEVVFVGPELKKTYSIFISVCESCKRKKKYIDSIGIALTYEGYFYGIDTKIREFQKPDIVIGYNLDLHESELGITEWTWEEAFSVLKKVNAPFILTAGTEERAKKDNERLCKLLEKSVSPLHSEPNPFAGLIPERDFETEELRYTNKHISIYEGFYEELTEPTDLKEGSVEREQRLITVGASEEQIDAEEKQETKGMFIFRGKESVEENQRSSAVGRSEKQFEAEKKKKLEEVFQFKGKQSEILDPQLKKESKSKNKKDSDVFQLKEKAVEDSEAEKEEQKTEHETLSSVDILIKEESRLLKENCLLKEVNNQLNRENKKLKQENDRLKAENQLIKDLRSQVKESIEAAMSEKQ